MAILLPSFLAGFRDSGVGTDMMVYGDKYFAYAKNISMAKFFAITGCEYGYGAFVYLVAYFTDKIFWMYFLTELIIISLVWKSFDEYINDRFKPFALLIYYFMFYSFSLNLMRQSIAMSILLYSFRFIRNQKKIPFLLCCVLAFLFHKTSIVGLTIYPIYQVCVTDNKGEYKQTNKLKHKAKRVELKHLIKKYRFIIIFFGIVIAILVVKNAKAIIAMLYLYFNDYHSIYYGLKGSGTSTIVYTSYMLLLLLFTSYGIDHRKTCFLFYFLMFAMNIIMYQLKHVSNAAYRISLYFSFFLVILLPKVIQETKSPRNRMFNMYVSFALINIYAYDYFVIRLYNETYPYTSKLLGIRG